MTWATIQPARSLNRKAVIFGLRPVDLALGGTVVSVIVVLSGGDNVFIALLCGIALLSAVSLVRANNRDRFLRDTLGFFLSRRSIYDCLSKKT
jgi:hypothetical protein